MKKKNEALRTMMSLNYLMTLLVSDIQSSIEYIIKKHETLTTNPPIHIYIHIYINMINSKFVFKIKDGYKLELQMPGTMKIFDTTKKIIDKTKNVENVPSLEVAEVDLVQCNLVDNQYQQKAEVLNIFVSNKFYAHLLNAELSNLLFLKTYNTEFDKIMITFANKNDRTLEIKDKVN